MKKSYKHIEIVRSTTIGLSSMSEVSCGSISAVLSKHFTRVGVTIVNNLADLESLAAGCPDLVFLGMEFIPAMPNHGITDLGKIWLSDFLDKHEIACTGSSQNAHMLARNKPIAKQCILDAGFRTPAYRVIKKDQVATRQDIMLSFPLFIKPTDRGGGQGIDSESVVYDFDQLCVKAGAIATKYQADTLVEEYLPGREFSVAILKDEESDKCMAMPIELIAPADSRGARLLSSHVKSSNSERALQVSDEIIKAKVIKLALDAFYALGARDYGRVDIRLDAFGEPHFLEANLIPSLISGYGSFPKACVLNIGLNYESMIMRIANLGLARKTKVMVDIPEPVILGGSVFPSADIALEPV